MTPAGLLRILTLLALLLAPLTMIGGHAAMAAPAPATAHQMDMATAPDHCAGMNPGSKARPGSGIDCTIACAALPAIGAPFPVPLLFPALAEPAPRIAARVGIVPEAATPPPRFS
jgi:hypothetical protein